MENNYFGIIYKATNIVNGKVYIGQTIQSLTDRITSHHSKADNENKTYFHRAISKYGKDSFVWETIEYCSSKEELDNMEYHYIVQYNSHVPSGYNMTLGGEGSIGRKCSQATKDKISTSKAGKPLSEEHKSILSSIRKGVKKAKDHVQKVADSKSLYWLITYPEGNQETIKNLSAFCRNNNLSDRGMWLVAHGRRSHHKGFKCINLTNNQ